MPDFFEPSSTDRTLDDAPEPWGHTPRTDPLRLGLCVVWSAAASWRVGELLWPDGTLRRFGRGRKPGPEALYLVPHRAGARPEALDDPALSRSQLELRSEGSRGIQWCNLGRRRTRVDGELAQRGRLTHGQLLEVENVISLLVVRRGPPPERAGPHGAADASGLVGESEAMWALRRTIDAVGRATAPVLITGPSGSGKELVARALHRASGRAGFVARNAATLPEGLVDAELFGNVKGYPHAGIPERPGLIGEADGGTLFLDEIGELPEALQAHLLRFLDDGSYHRLGESRVRRADVRVVAATNRDVRALKSDVAARFVRRVEVPPLTARREDIPLLVRHLARRWTREDPGLARFVDERGEPRLHPDLVHQLLRHPWSHNVRELDRTLRARAAASAGDWITADPSWRTVGSRPVKEGEVDPTAITRAALESALIEAGGVREKAWRALGLRSRHQLTRLLRKHGVS